MQNHAPGTAVTVMAQLQGEGGETLIPTGVRWRVLDEADAELQTWTILALSSPVTPVVSVVVPLGLNALVAPAIRGIRRVEFEVTTADKVQILSESYLLQGATALVFGVNTFLTHSQAQLLAMDFSSQYVMPYLNALTKDDQEQALIQAYSRIIKLPLKMEYEATQDRITIHPWGYAKFEDLTPEQIANLEPRMLASLKRAQLVEATHILTEDGVNSARKSGLMSMTVGESSQFFRPAKPLELGVCKDAYRELVRWIDRKNRIGRA